MQLISARLVSGPVGYDPNLSTTPWTASAARSINSARPRRRINDSKGRVTSTIDTLNNTTSSIYDARDELIQTIYPVDPNYPAGTTSESFFDAEGLRDSPPNPWSN